MKAAGPLCCAACWPAHVTLGCRSDAGAPTAEEAHRFVEAAEARLEDAWQQGEPRRPGFRTTSSPSTRRRSPPTRRATSQPRSAELARGARRFEELPLPDDDARKLKLLKLMLSAPAPDNQAERDELSSLSSSLEGDYGKGQVLPQREWQSSIASTSTLRRTSLPRAAIRRSSPMSGRGGTPSARPCAIASAASSSCRTRARASWALRIPECCGARTTTCRPTHSPPRSIACGRKCGRSTCRCTPTCDRSSRKSTALACFQTTGCCRPTSSATCGRRTGPTSIRWSRRRRPATDTT